MSLCRLAQFGENVLELGFLQAHNTDRVKRKIESVSETADRHRATTIFFYWFCFVLLTQFATICLLLLLLHICSLFSTFLFIAARFLLIFFFTSYFLAYQLCAVAKVEFLMPSRTAQQ